jgi:hypothetical protein
MFTALIMADHRAVEFWDYSPLKHLDLLGVSWWNLMPVRKEVMEEKLAAEVPERRSIITRKIGVPLPTWDGSTPAFIFDPMIWYFDPDSGLENTDNDSAAGEFTIALDEICDGFTYSPPANPCGWLERESEFTDDTPRILPVVNFAKGLARRRHFRSRNDAIAQNAEFDDAANEIRYSYLVIPPGDHLRGYVPPYPPSLERLFPAPETPRFRGSLCAWEPDARELWYSAFAYSEGARAHWSLVLKMRPKKPDDDARPVTWNPTIDSISGATQPEGTPRKRCTLFEFMIEHPNFTLVTERPVYYGSTYLYR